MTFYDEREEEIEELVAAPRKVGRVFDALDWQDRAACKGEGPDLFFGPAGERPEAARARESFVQDQFCSRCEVAATCRDFARRHREYRLWAETEHERVTAGFAPDMTVGVSSRLATLLRRGLVVR